MRHNMLPYIHFDSSVSPKIEKRFLISNLARLTQAFSHLNVMLGKLIMEQLLNHKLNQQMPVIKDRYL